MKRLIKTLLLIMVLLCTLPIYGCTKEGAKKISSEKEVSNDEQLTKKDEQLLVDKEKKKQDTRENWIKQDGEISFPILMYHSLSEGNSLRVPPSEFKEHMQWLKDNGYYTLSPEEACIVLTENIKPAEKIVWVVFDDGYTDNITEGFPILKELKMKATICYITKQFTENDGSMLNLDQLKEMKDSKLIDIESHTVNHVELNSLPKEQQLQEMVDSKKILDDSLSKDTTVLCYPVGRYNEDTIKSAEEAGYKLALTTELGLANKGQGLYKLKRVRVFPGMNGQAFGNYIESF